MVSTIIRFFFKKISDKDVVIKKKYKLFDLTKFILVLPTFLMIQQSLSKTKCSMKCLHSGSKLPSNGTLQNHLLKD